MKKSEIVELLTSLASSLEATDDWVGEIEDRVQELEYGGAPERPADPEGTACDRAPPEAVTSAMVIAGLNAYLNSNTFPSRDMVTAIYRAMWEAR